MGQANPNPNTLFIVDDNPDNLRLLSTLLAQQGYIIRKALNADFALKSIQQTPPDLILLDINMPRMSGYKMCEVLKANAPTAEIPVIFISALDTAWDKVKAFKVGGADFITKPFQLEEVLARIDHQLLLQAQKQQLKVEIQERQRAEKSLEVSLQMVSHDLRNPVLGMSMVLNHYLHAATVDQASIAVEREILDQMRQSCDRQLSLINSLVETQQFEHHGVPLVLRFLSLETLINDFLSDWALRLEAQAIQVQLEIPPSLPLLKADANYLWRVFDNLIANALKHNPPPRRHPLSLQILVTTTVEAILCRVIDNGVGIATAIADQIFEPYQRGNAHNDHAGLGLGLYTSRQIIQAHGGEMGLNQTVESGTDIWFTLPLPPDASP
jgi:two-component system sensor histidine kinase/response regulator